MEDTVSWHLMKQDLVDIAHGATFLGAGGGGTLSTTLDMIDKHFPADELVKLVTVEEAAQESGLTAVCGMIGSQTIGHDLSNPLAAGYAVDRFRRLMIEMGRGEVVRLIPMELGVQSAAIANLILANARGMSVVDGDGAGRAVPTSMNTTYAGYGPSPYPAVGATDTGVTVISEAGSVNMYSEVMRGMAMRADIGIVGVALWPMDGPTLRTAVPVRGGLSTALHIGRALRAADDKVRAVLGILHDQGRWAEELFRGTLTNVSSAAMDYSVVEVAGADGSAYEVMTAGESVIANRGSDVIGMGPDSLCWMTADGRTCSNTEVANFKGQEVILVGIAAHPALRDSTFIMSYFKYFLTKARNPDQPSAVTPFDDYVPIEQLHGGR
jgi:DUF917 family protein